MAFCKSRANREVHNTKNLPQETRETSNKKPNLKAKAIKKEVKKNPKVSRRKDIIKSDQKKIKKKRRRL